jgi:hypothetical protein
MKDLARLNRLEHLWLGQNPVTDVGLKELAVLKGLRFVGLSGTQVTYTGAAELKRAVPGLEIGR